MRESIYDIEADGLLDTITKIHCLSYCYVDDPSNVISVTSYDDIKAYFLRTDIIRVGHNIVQYDEKAVIKILGIQPNKQIVDTLPFSWYLFPKRKKHGLEGWGEEFGVKKPVILDWNNQSVEDYIHRCEEDVKINTILWKREKRLLLGIYEDEALLQRFINYIMSKMDQISDQEDLGLKIDVEHCKRMVEKLSKEKEQKVEDLKAAMPKVAVYSQKTYKDCVIDDDGTIYKKGELFYMLLIGAGKPNISEHVVKTVKGWKDPKPTSSIQLKKWLYSLGWVPENIKHVRNKDTNEVKMIPQIAAKTGQGEICPSIHKLFVKEPKLEILSGLTVITHRLAMFQGFLNDQVGGRLYGTSAGLTNTLRLKHSIIVNLPGLDKKYGPEVRATFIADEGHILCGADLTGIEDSTKRHYIYKYDPKYVEEMNRPGFDPHTDIGVLAGMMTKAEEDFYKACEVLLGNDEKLSPEDSKEYKRIKFIRGKAKIVNFSATYKIGADALARNSGLSLREAKKLLIIYWERNKAIKQIEADLTVRTINGEMWQQNPVSKFWYSLRTEKDRFSTLNQGTAVYVFDIWVAYCRKLGIRIPFQYHDEILFNTIEGTEKDVREKILRSMELVNERLKLNIEVRCSVQFAHSYDKCH